MQLVKGTQPVPRQRAGPFFDIALEQGPDTGPERRYEAGPGIMELGSEVVSRAFRVSEQP